MLVYRLVTSIVTRSVLSDTGALFRIILTKSVVPLMYDLIFGTKGFKKKSTNSEICSVVQPFAEIVGRPGGGLVGL